MKKLIPILILLILLTENVLAAPLPQTESQEYIVQAGDWLSKLAYICYGDVLAFPLIVKTTNTKAAEDTSFTVITNPDLIEVGQKLWIPASCNIKAYKAVVVRIEQAARDGDTKFSLSQQWLTTLPPEIGQLTNLQELWLLDNQLSSLPPEIGLLQNLQQLDLWGNPLTSLPPEVEQLPGLRIFR